MASTSAPLLTGAGIAGIAIGFGAQTLVRDVLSGFFLILEDQVRVGDFAAINGTGRAVEQLNLRTIVLRDVQGTVHVFPNGAINTLANQSKDFSRYIIDLNISYDEDPDRVSDIAREVDRELEERSDASNLYILEPIQILGVDGILRMVDAAEDPIKTVPRKAVARRARVPQAPEEGAEPSWDRGSIPGLSSAASDATCIASAVCCRSYPRVVADAPDSPSLIVDRICGTSDAAPLCRANRPNHRVERVLITKPDIDV